MHVLNVAGAAGIIILLANVCQAEILDPRTTTLPVYVLPGDAAVDGNVDDWAGIPPSAVPGNFRFADRNETVSRTDSFAPSLRCGVKKGGSDLYFLVVVHDPQLYSEESPHWMTGDQLELFLDFGREARGRDAPGWFNEPAKWHTPHGMGQFGFRPRTLQVEQKTFYSALATNWKADFASSMVEDGIAYEVRLDAASVLAGLDMAELPAFIGIDFGLADQDYMARLRTDSWANDNGMYRLFGDGMDHAFTTKYGMLATRPVPVPAGCKPEPLPQTLQKLFGEFPTADDVMKAIGALPDHRLANLVAWAGCQGLQLDAELVKHLMATGSPRVCENCLAVLYFTDQDAAAAKEAVHSVYAADPRKESPYVLTLANMLNEKHSFGYRERLVPLLVHKDLTVSFSAAGALAAAGGPADLPLLELTLQSICADLDHGKTEGADRKAAAYGYFFGLARETLAARTEPITIPAFTPAREVRAENTDLERFIPIDGNNVYNGKDLLRSWPKEGPKEGPKELWRAELGQGKSAVVGAAGRAFTAMAAEGKQWAVCLQPATGKMLWKAPIATEDAQPIATPVVDGDHVYFVPSRKGQEEGLGIVCLHAADGREIWRGTGELELTESCATPLIVGDAIYCPLYSGKESPFSPLAAADKLTGALLWKAPETGRRGSGIASPSYQVIDGIPQVVLSVYGRPMNEVWGVSAKTGELFWRYAANAHYGMIPSPVAAGSRVFICDGIPPFSACLQMYVRGGKIKARQVYRDAKRQCNLYNTVSVLDGAVYGCSNSSLQCTDFGTGKLLWKQEGKDWANAQQLIVADGLVFVLTTFDVILVEASKARCRELGRVRHGIELGYQQQPTLANGRLYVRGDTWVVCYDVAERK